MMLAAAHPNSPQKVAALRNQSMGKRESFEEMMRKERKRSKRGGDHLGVGDSDDEDVEDEQGSNSEKQSQRQRKGKPEPMRPAAKSALFRPRFISPSKMSRNSRSSLLPLGLNRRDSRRMLRSDSVLLPSEKLVLQERKTPAELLAEKLAEKLKADAKADGNSSKGAQEGENVAAAVVRRICCPSPQPYVEAEADAAGSLERQRRQADGPTLRPASAQRRRWWARRTGDQSSPDSPRASFR